SMPRALPDLPPRRPPEVPVEVPVDAPEAPLATPPRRPRPLTVTLLIALWALSIPLYDVGAVALSWQALGAGRAAPVAGGRALAAVSAAMGVGLWQARPWAHVGQVVIAGLGLFLCPFTLASVAVLVYMLRPAARWHFSDRREEPPEGAGQVEIIFAGAIVGAVLLCVILLAAGTCLARTSRPQCPARLRSRPPS